jgi:hypothetical protein
MSKNVVGVEISQWPARLLDLLHEGTEACRIHLRGRGASPIVRARRGRAVSHENTDAAGEQDLKRCLDSSTPTACRLCFSCMVTRKKEDDKFREICKREEHAQQS